MQDDKGTLFAVNIQSVPISSIPSLKGSGIVNVPTPKEEEVVRQMKRKDTTLDSILAKYK